MLEVESTCLKMWGATSDFPFTRLPYVRVYRVAGKIFALESIDDGTSVTLKHPPGKVRALVDSHPGIDAAWRMNKRHWISVSLNDDLVSESLCGDLIETSHSLILGKLSADELGDVIVRRGTRTAHSRMATAKGM